MGNYLSVCGGPASGHPSRHDPSAATVRAGRCPAGKDDSILFDVSVFVSPFGCYFRNQFFKFFVRFSADGTIPKLNTAVFDFKLHSNELEECFSKWKSGLDDFGIGSAAVFE